MSHTWGRTDAAGTWPHPKPVWTMAALLIAMVSRAALGTYQYAAVWTPLQRLYRPSYVRSALMSGLGFTTNGRYRLLQVVDRTGSRFALDREVRSVRTPTGEPSFALIETAVQMDVRRLVWHDQSYHHAKVHAFLGHWIYRDQSVWDLVRPAAWGGLGAAAGDKRAISSLLNSSVWRARVVCSVVCKYSS